MIFNFSKIACLLIALGVLSACSDNSSTELAEWMATVKKDTKLSIPKLVPPKIYVPVSYQGKDQIDPFNAD